MPHTFIQHSTHFNQYDFKPLLATIANSFVLHCNAVLDANLGYTQCLDNVLVGAQAGDNRALLWVHLRLKAGRTQEQKNAVMLAIHDAIEEHVGHYVRQHKLFCEPRIELTELTADYITMSLS